MTARRAAVGVAGAAFLVAGVTVVARVVGFGRWLVFSGAVGDTCLGSAYATANMVPNIVFEVVAGGALASAVVPLLAGPLARGETEDVRRTASALLTWALLVLVPLSVLGAVAAGPVMAALLGDLAGCDDAEAVAVAARMFVVFAPQVALYGVAVVGAGILHAHRRFLAPALAPLLSSAVVVAAYAWFGIGYTGSRDDLGELPRRWELVLSIGTTAGVAALALTVAGPVAALRLGLRPALGFPPGVAAAARRLALAGLAALVAQQLSLLVVIVLTNRYGGAGALPVYNYAWAVYLLPYAVLAVPIATSAFPALAAAAGPAGSEDRDAFVRTSATTTRAVALVSLLGTGVLAGTAWPVARTFIDADAGPEALAWALMAFAPGLLGYGLVAHLGRALYASGGARAAATATAAGWLAMSAVAAVLVPAVPAEVTVAAIGAANSVGMLLAGGLLLRALARRAGPATLAGLPRALLAGLTGAVLGAGAAAAVGGAVVPTGRVANGIVAAVAAGLAGVVVVGVVLLLDGKDLRAVVAGRSDRG